ncbi:MAG: hypothetical protein ACRDMA_14085 [Solirubrobacterales bacterium]
MAVHDDSLYVGDFANTRVAVYTLEGAFRRAFGKDVVPGNLEAGFEVCTAVCKTGVEGNGPGELETPTGLATDAAGNVYVTESFNNRVSVFSSEPSFLRAFGHDVVPGNAGTGFEVCTTDCKRGVGGGPAGALHLPLGVAVGGGEIYVGDQFNHRVSVFSPSPAFLRAFGKDVVPANLEIGFEICIEQCQIGAEGNGPGELELSTRPRAAARSRGRSPGTAGARFLARQTSGLERIQLRQGEEEQEEGDGEADRPRPGPGELALERTRRVKRAGESVGAAEKVRLTIRSRAKAHNRLNASGKARVRARVTYTPTGGEPNTNTKSKRIGLRKRR